MHLLLRSMCLRSVHVLVPLNTLMVTLTMALACSSHSDFRLRLRLPSHWILIRSMAGVIEHIRSKSVVIIASDGDQLWCHHCRHSPIIPLALSDLAIVARTGTRNKKSVVLAITPINSNKCSAKQHTHT